MKVEKWAVDVVQDIANTLNECGGDFIAEIANQVLDAKVTYVEDSMFEVEYSVNE